MLARAVTLALTQNPSASFTWVCGKQHHMQALDLIDPHIRPRVQMRDWMPQEQLISILDRHGIFLFPSYFEGFGKAPLEAMARGLCVVASDCGGMRDYISTGRNGFLSPVGQPEAMAKTAAELMGNVDLSQQVSRQARLTAESHTWDRCAADEEDFFRHLIDWKRKGGRKT
jgi:glycosyltransferase involved in cell wall biosynthesis